MQIMYVLTFLISLFVLASTAVKKDIEVTDNRADAVGVHMTMWHKIALETCNSSACSTASVRAALPEPIKSGKAFAADRFTSRFDNTPNDQKVVTYLSTAYARDSTTNAGIISSFLQENVAGQSSDIGIWNKARGLVIYGNAASADSLASRQELKLPAAIGINIPDGSPVLIGRP